jgi:3',5'-cyclic AMP phosphodiesterase CpdA
MKRRITIYNLFMMVMLWFAFVPPATAACTAEQDTLTFIHLTDIHVCNLAGYHPFFTAKRQHFGDNIRTFPVFLDSVSDKRNSDFIVITGDNIDFYEAENEKSEMLDTQIEQYSHLLDHSEIPVYLTLGNHDITSYIVNPDPAVRWSQLDAERARAAWIRNIPCFKEGTYYSHDYKIDTVTFRLIFLDNSYYASEEVSDGVLPFIIDQYQLRWLDDQMKASPSDVEIIFMHEPLPYLTSSGNKTLAEPLSGYSSKTKAYNLISVLEKNSSARLIFAGHKHINSINKYTLSDGDNLTQVMTAAFGYDTASWRIIKITKDNILISFPGSSKTEYAVPVR